jgi:hypothetical protein
MHNNSSNLIIELEQIRAKLHHLATGTKPNWLSPDSFRGPKSFLSNIPLNTLCNTFCISDSERQVILLCLAAELIPDFYLLCTQLQNNSQQPYPTIHLAQYLFTLDDVDLLSPQIPIHKWKIIQLDKGLIFRHCPLRLDPAILSYILGKPCLDPYLCPYITPVPNPLEHSPLPPTYQTIVQQLEHIWQTEPAQPIQLVHSDLQIKEEIVLSASIQNNYQLHKLHLSDIPTQPELQYQLILHWQRHSALYPSILLLECSSFDPDNAETKGQLSKFINRLQCPVLISSPIQLRLEIPLTTVEIPFLTISEQHQLWQHYLGSHFVALSNHLNQITSTFNLSPHHIKAIAHSTLTQTQDPAVLPTQLWVNCRNRTRSQLESFARRIDAKATWDDLVLPDLVIEPIQQIIAQMRDRHIVYEDWELAGNSRRGLGIVAMFHGSSGTGKTTAAEIIAHTLDLDLYRIDLSQVVSKYIGETEKNLSAIFDAAERSGAILQFDEADSIIGKRSEVKDARDRYANQEVGYVLQRIESYSGLAILTTNLPNAIDSAFQRRMRFIVGFELPNQAQRVEIWHRLLRSSKMPIEGFNPEMLSQFQISGASIVNIARNAAFLGASERTAVQPQHIVAAARSELQKLGRGMTVRELEGWPRDY